MAGPWEKYGQQPQGVYQIPLSPAQRAEESRKAAAEARAAMAAAQAAGRFKMDKAEFDMKYNPLPTPGDTNKTGDEYLATLPKSLAAQVKALADGRRAFPTGAALRSPQMQELLAAATQYDPTLDAANAATRVATRKDFTSGKAAQNITAMNTALGHLGTLAKAAGALDNSSFRLWNTMGNATVTAFGDPRVKNFTLARNAVANELMKVFRGTGGSVTEIQEWQHNIDAADSPDQLRATITQATDLLRSRLEAVGDQYARGMGKSGDPISFLSPHAQEIYKQITESPDPLKPMPAAGVAGGPQGGPNGGNGGGGANPFNQPYFTPGGGPGAAGYGATTQMGAIPEGMQREYDGFLSQWKGNPDQYVAFRNDLDRRYGFTPTDENSAKYREWATWAAQKLQNGGTIPTQIPGATVQMNGLEQARNNALYSAPAAFLANAADSLSAGTVGALGGRRGQDALSLMSQVSPTASTTGTLVGGVAGAGLAEAALAARAPLALARFAPRIADGGYGALSGFNGSEEGQGLKGAAIGTLLGVGGGTMGERALRAAGAGVRGVRDDAVQYLNNQGIPLTVGQIVGNSGIVGRGIKKIEDAATSIPLVGNAIEARRREGVQAFNQRAFDIAGQPINAQITDVGPAGIRQLGQARTDAYGRALDPVTIDPTQGNFLQDIAGVRQNALRIPNVNGAQDAAIAGIDSRVSGAIDPNTGLIPGRNFQEVYRGLARTGRERANSDYGHEVGQVMRQGQDALADALETQNPGAFTAFRQANDANRRLNVLVDAVNAAKNQEDNLFTPAQLNRADAASASRLTGKFSAASGNRPFAQLAEAGQAVLPSKIGESGTASRLAVQRALSALALTAGAGGTGYASGGAEGAGTGTGLGLAAALTLALGGSQSVQRALARGLLNRPDRAIRIGEQIQRRAPIGGIFGAGLAPALMPGQ